MQQQCNKKLNDSQMKNFDFLGALFKAEGVSMMYDTFSDKTDEELETIVNEAAEMVVEYRKILAKALCTLRSRMSDYRFEKLLKRQSIQKKFARKSAEYGAKLFEMESDR